VGRDIGEVDFIVDFDGRGLPGKARKLGNEAGEVAGEGFNKGFSKNLTSLAKELREEMNANGELAGASFTESMQNVIRRNKQGIADDLASIFGKNNGLSDFVKQTGSVDNALGDLRSKMRELNEAGGLSTQMYDNLNVQLDEFESKTRAASRASSQRLSVERDLNLAMDRAIRAQADGEDRLRNAVASNTKEFDRRRFSLRSLLPTISAHIDANDKLGAAMDRLEKKTSRASRSGNQFKQSFRFNQLPDQLQDIIFIGAIIAALGTDIAVLGSAAGGGLAALGIGALAAVTGVGVLVAGIKGITGPLEDIAPAARPAATELQALGKQFVAMKQSIQGRLFADLAPDIRNLGEKLLPVLGKGFDTAADAGNRFFRNLATRLTTPKALEDMDRLLTGFGPILDSLFNTILNLGSGIGSVFTTGLPTAEKFFGYLERITGEFANWAESEEGRERIAEWFRTAEIIGPKVANLLGVLGDTLSGLVTPETIDKLGRALDGLSNLLPAVGGFLDTVGKLDPIGLFIAALQTISDILSPLKPAFDNLAGSLSGNLTTGLDTVKGLFDKLSPALEPVVNAIADDLVPALLGPGGLLEAFTGLAEDTLPTLAPALEDTATALADIATALADVLPALKPVLDLITPGVAASFSGLAAAVQLLTTNWDDLDKTFSDSDFIDNITEFGEKKDFGIWKTIGDGAAGLYVTLFKAGQEFGRFNLELTSFNEDVNRNLGLFWDGVGQFFEDKAGAIGDFLSDLFTPDSEWAADLDENVNQALDDFWTGVGTWFSDRAGDIGKWFTDLFSPGKDSADTAASDIGSSFDTVQPKVAISLGGIGAKIAELFAPATPAVQGIADRVGQIWATPPTTIGGLLSNVARTIVAPFESAPGSVGRIASQVSQIWATPPTTIGGLMSRVGLSIVTPFTQAPGQVGAIAQQLVNLWPSIPGRISGFFSGIGQRIGGAFSAAVGAAQSTVSGIVGAFSGLPGRILGAIGNIGAQVASRLNFANAITLPKTATGGMFNGAQARIIGEAGPEAVVPLNRPLSQVDPAVRDLSAIAQGKARAGSDSGPSLTINDGAIQVVTGASEPDNIGESVLDHIVANLPK
jgi:phage-related protein